jgi:transaldolase/glucose-6-phosphate isomerase
MGGSSLAPETFAGLLGREKEGMLLRVLDSTHPAAVEAALERQDTSRSLLIVSTKSGTTVETLSLFRFFYRRLALSVGPDRARRQCVAITDPGSPLAIEAGRLRLLRLFLGDPTVGGRYAALSPFGLLPAALIGIDLQALVKSAGAMADACRAPTQANPAAQLAAALAAAARAGRDKLTLTTSTSIKNLAPWIEQLVAESTGKDGRGILPVLSESLGPPSVYGSDRVFLDLRLAEESPDPQLATLERAGQPSISVVLDSVDEIGGAFFLWECATALLAHLMGVHPFNQPDVDSAKDLARQEVEDYYRTGGVNEVVLEPLLAEEVAAFVDEGRAGDYVALQAFLPPEGRTSEALGLLRQVIRDRTCLATSQGYGPRYLHSAGQLHKGDRGNGRFI